MLRLMIGEEPRKDGGLIFEVNAAIDEFCKRLRSDQDCATGVQAKWIRLDLWAVGLRNALDELEQSVYCSNHYGVNITELSEEEMSEDKHTNYYRHLYFYKNAFIRIFSTLDKAGYFLDTLYDLETARVKAKFSYYTVLRQLHNFSSLSTLDQQLYELKVKYQKPMGRLKTRRNLEIHSLNAELIDDVWRKRQCFATTHMVEPVHNNLEDLQRGFVMVCESLLAIFAYCSRSIHR